MVFKYVHKTAKTKHTYNEERTVKLIPFLAVIPDSLEIQTDENGTITDETMIDILIDKVHIANIDLESKENINIPKKYQKLVSEIEETICNI
jgi:hypothetical protein